MKQVRILSDYTPANQPSVLTIVQDDQGDVHISLYFSNRDEKCVRIAASGTRHSPKIRQAFYNLIAAYQEEVRTTKDHDIKELNE